MTENHFDAVPMLVLNAIHIKALNIQRAHIQTRQGYGEKRLGTEVKEKGVK
jgi:hypothetical protein